MVCGPWSYPTAPERVSSIEFGDSSFPRPTIDRSCNRLLEPQDCFVGREEQGVPLTPREEFHLWVGLPPIGFEAQRQFRIGLRYSPLRWPLWFSQGCGKPFSGSGQRDPELLGSIENFDWPY